MKTKRTPQGIEPGFAYNPGKAWLSGPATLPAEYEAVLQARGFACVTAKPDLPTPRKVTAADLLPAATPADVAASAFLAQFGRLQ